ncbi:benzoate-CoA ligase family protein [Pandoraea nosoerga]|uniref:4-hydroxybenzoate--CoA ligase n=1 Tax=Pandoraea nosoerga TaxID=2508296 RepID=A0A5E4U4W7_9BURK|nr:MULTISPECIES: benzoate-CoA ligase family protein [Pandoraea]MBN4667829.1 benzoate-CoA ligase family protein [Pandoraea nosoerga]MBN4677691.1 benzoate-CoA ligase family protein [Pandoraea nosoerga]MBN4682698.1 benzoate-CoA ligase family protein [Pandoraea nosoerga]MBN4746897.1 benzoate-CoA ligase family protein [Pandoraea nosoerga]VVD94811.1 4-hydroxybenzoate--CoA ligase [Pandoraea nosoerga]
MEAVLTPPPVNFNFAAHLEALNRERAAKTAYIDDTRTLTYGELAERSRRFATGLARAGVHREARILLIMLDTVDLPVAFLGALYAGVVPVVVNTLLTADDYAYMIAHSKARLVIASGALMPAVQAALAKVAERGSPPPCVVSQPIAAGSGTQTGAPVPPTFEAMVDGPPSALPADTSADDIAFWLYSSGSTGKPKGTVHTHANLYWTAETYARHVLGIREDDIAFSAAKLFFAYGLGNGLTFPLSVGATVVLMAERPTAEAVARRLVQHRPTIFYGVPTLYATLLASPHLPAREDVSLRLCTSAGEALPREIGERFTAHFGAEILDGIGSTEMLHIFLSNRAGRVAYGTTGEPVPGYAVELRDENGKPVPDGEIGDLYIKGPSAALMYWCNREKSRATFLGEWLKSGDKYQRLPNGYYVYAGRSDDMLKVSGQYVSPIEVEMVLMQHDAVLEAGVVGRDDNGLTKTRAFVVLKPGVTPTDAMAAELKAFVKARLAPHKYPRELVFVDDLPKTATGKVQRFKLRELL